MMDEHCDFGTIFNRKDDYSITWVFEAYHVEEMMGKRTAWRPRKSTSVEEMANPFST
jgi:hypothetical protein